jgi:uncharacterized iron-regulated protein
MIKNNFSGADLLKKMIAAILLCGLLPSGCWAKEGNLNRRVFDLNRQKALKMPEMLAELKKSRIILVGEHHGNPEHHAAQLEIIRALNEAGRQVTVGLEMFMKNSQPALDQWIAGDIDDKRFEEIYYENWDFPWPAYRDIFEYARDHKIPMIGLNVPREITRQVSREGFKSLSPDQKQKLSDISCIVDQKYMNYIRQAYGGHSHARLNFTYFCEAQMVWDNAIAVYTLDYLSRNPDAVVVILTGTGHAQKGAVPRQIRARSDLPCAVILPEIPGRIDVKTISNTDADFIILDKD